MHAFIRKWLAEKVSQEVSAATRIIYGKCLQAHDIHRVSINSTAMQYMDAQVPRGLFISAFACTFRTLIERPQGSEALALAWSTYECTSGVMGWQSFRINAALGRSLQPVHVC